VLATRRVFSCPMSRALPPELGWWYRKSVPSSWSLHRPAGGRSLTWLSSERQTARWRITGWRLLQLVDIDECHSRRRPPPAGRLLSGLLCTWITLYWYSSSAMSHMTAPADRRAWYMSHKVPECRDQIRTVCHVLNQTHYNSPPGCRIKCPAVLLLATNSVIFVNENENYQKPKKITIPLTKTKTKTKNTENWN